MSQQGEIVKICTMQLIRDPITAFNNAIEENTSNIPLNQITKAINPLSLALQRGKKWKTGSTIYVKFLSGGSEKLRDKIRNVARLWEEFANIKLYFITSTSTKKPQIRIKISSSGSSWSYIGTDALSVPQERPTLEFGWLNDRTSADEINRVVLHEIGHALGAIHEHQNPKAFGKIPWNKQAVYNYYAKQGWSKADVDNNIFDTYDKESTNSTEFDPESIMQYAVPNSLTNGDYEIGFNEKLSPTDKEFISVMYPFDVKNEIELLDGKPIEANIGKSGEEDYYFFDAMKFTKGVKDITIQTTGETDLIMGLLDYTKKNVLAYDNDSGVSRNAKIIYDSVGFTDVKQSKYYIRIRHYKVSGTGKYSIVLKVTPKPNV